MDIKFFLFFIFMISCCEKNYIYNSLNLNNEVDDKNIENFKYFNISVSKVTSWVCGEQTSNLNNFKKQNYDFTINFKEKIINEDILNEIEIYHEIEDFKENFNLEKAFAENDIVKFINKINAIRIHNSIEKIYKEKCKKQSKSLFDIIEKIYKKNLIFDINIFNIISSYSCELYLDDIRQYMLHDDEYIAYLDDKLCKLEFLARQTVVYKNITEYIENLIEYQNILKPLNNTDLLLKKIATPVLTRFKRILCGQSQILDIDNYSIVQLKKLKYEYKSIKFSCCCCLITKLDIFKIFCFGWLFELCCFKDNSKHIKRFKKKRDLIFEELDNCKYMMYPGLKKTLFQKLKNRSKNMCKFVTYTKFFGYLVSRFYDCCCLCINQTINFSRLDLEESIGENSFIAKEYML